ncbi:MAG: glutamate racemase [Candidatus Levybacteria bacterium]|nr:glutamate racemase [Candidatus Levybacteria bacterium]
MSNQPIGILDSGIGGLSIWKEIVTQLPDESTIYIADSKNCPYGTRTQEEVYGLAKLMVNFLVGKGAKIIVLACNTVTVSCLDKLREDFLKLPIVGTVPVVKTATEKTFNGKIGILSTPSTASSAYQRHLIEQFAKNCEVINLGTKNLVPFVEKGETNTKKVKDVLRKELDKFIVNKVDTIALGCSHFPFLRKAMETIMGKKVMILDSTGAIARQTKRVLANSNKLSSQPSPLYEFYTTNGSKEFINVARKLVGNEMAKKIESVENVSLS